MIEESRFVSKKDKWMFITFTAFIPALWPTEPSSHCVTQYLSIEVKRPVRVAEVKYSLN
jgi:hypothetical protein